MRADIEIQLTASLNTTRWRVLGHSYIYQIKKLKIFLNNQLNEVNFFKNYFIQLPVKFQRNANLEAKIVNLEPKSIKKTNLMTNLTNWIEATLLLLKWRKSILFKIIAILNKNHSFKSGEKGKSRSYSIQWKTCQLYLAFLQ